MCVCVWKDLYNFVLRYIVQLMGSTKLFLKKSKLKKMHSFLHSHAFFASRKYLKNVSVILVICSSLEGVHAKQDCVFFFLFLQVILSQVPSFAIFAKTLYLVLKLICNQFFC